MNEWESLKHQLLALKTTAPRFSWNMIDADAARRLLTASYAAEVEYRKMTFRATPEVEAMISQAVKHLTRREPRLGICLCGMYGNGKTTMLRAIQSATNYLRQLGYFASIEDVTYHVGLRIVDARELHVLARNDDAWNRLRNTSMVAIEDLGKEATNSMEYGNVLLPVEALIEYRYANQLYTAVTTNLTTADIRTKYGNRLADRFNEMMDVLVFKGSSYRTKLPD